MRTIQHKFRSQKVNMGGIILDQPLPQRNLDMVDPFLLIHHWDDKLPGQQSERKLGVGPHPHRGFAPVTFIFNGGVHHRDSTGHQSIVYAGGTQWMNSGRGIVHSERPPKEMAEKGGHFELIQFWVNVPAAHKLDEASYQPLPAEKTPMHTSADGNITVGIVAGNYKGKQSSLDTKSELLILRGEGEAGGTMKLDVPSAYNALIYNLDGALKVNGTEVLGAREMAVFANDGDDVAIEVTSKSRFIMLSGIPMNEPVVSYGPFVMNTEREIMDAINDYQQGKLGTLNEVFD